MSNNNQDDSKIESWSALKKKKKTSVSQIDSWEDLKEVEAGNLTLEPKEDDTQGNQ